MWPRAESNVYAEPKRLAAAGLATSREEWTGSRRRTIYSITDSGRKALAEWLASSSARQRYESEALLKVLFAENGTKDDLLATIRAIRKDAIAVREHFLRFADVYEAGDGQYPDRFDLSALAARLLCEQQAVTARWAFLGRRDRLRLGRAVGRGCRLGDRDAPGERRRIHDRRGSGQSAALNRGRAGR
jgi:DNA-binding PadR family transcriptional regulator